ncbi:DUF3592 domain-containing protein [Streptomyces sp. Q6]|uniref:DUF3592 domain-containing protein n=1 Tax=Streptomyces citrinus TaxID=3118173 RepID=A0ACD5AIN0_9ACTN
MDHVRGDRVRRRVPGSNPPAHGVGERVEVLFRAGSPENARINGFVSLRLLPLVLGGLRLLAAGLGHRASGIGHRASGIGHRASGRPSP